MGLNKDRDFRKFLESANPYNTIQCIANSARKLCRTHNNLLESEAITHIIHNTEPDNKIYASARDEYIASQIKELFCYIDDKAICDAVYDSFYESKNKNNLIYIYNQVTEPNKQARIRVLTRILWYKLIK